MEQDKEEQSRDRGNDEAISENKDVVSPDEEELARTKSTASIAETFSLPREILFISIICLAQFMTQGALGNCLNLLHVIGDSFGLDNPAELSWLIAGYSLTVGTFILVSGRLGDVFGYKRLFLIGFVWFAIWSMVAGLATYADHVLFIFARVLQGIGPAIIMPNAIAILGASYRPGARKTVAFALFGACAPGGNVFAAVFAGLFVKDHEEWWPWAFYGFAIGLIFIAAVAFIVIPDPPHKLQSANMTYREIWDQLDILGATTGITALILFNFAWNQAPIVGWETPYVYALLIVGVALVPVFFYVELRVASHPLIPFDALTSEVGFILACIACGWSAFGIWIYYTWQFFQLLRGASPLLTAAWMSPVAISGAAASMITAWLLHFTQPALVMLIALASFTTGTVLMMTAPVGQSYWLQSFFSLIIMTFGMDMSFPAATLILSNAVKREHQGIAASLVSTVVNYSISLGLGFAATVEVHVNHGGETEEDLLFGYRAAWYMAVGLAGLGFAISFIYFYRRVRNDGVLLKR
ncbi:multidrug-resistance type transporter aminotriazole resistance [Neonectria magnoliae]|uniref:Multidrug-resistance type transporter aminotriazole resistance n=1 Tax=Neonectria magnoliae TaxID=2732573 RepID=A0ABR1I381_9HYPO